MNKSILALMLISMSLSVAVAEPSNPLQLSAEEMDQVSAGMGGALHRLAQVLFCQVYLVFFQALWARINSYHLSSQP